MHVTLRTFLLKSIPYLLAIAGGAVLYWLTADKIQNPDLRDLVNNIAASLLSIPLVFLLYDYSNFLISRQLARTQTDTVHDKIDTVLINLVLLVRQMLGMRGKINLRALNQMTDMPTREIARRIKLRPNHIRQLQSCYQELDGLIYRGADINIMPAVQVQSLTTLAHNILHLVNVHRFHHDTRASAQYVQKIIGFIADWVDSDAAASMHFQQLIGDNTTDAPGKGQNSGVTAGSMIGPRGRAETALRKNE